MKKSSRMITAWRRAAVLIAPLAALGILLSGGEAFATAQCFPLVSPAGPPIEEVEIRVTGRRGTLVGAFGWGVHFSTVTTEDGYGGAHSECHLNFSSATQNSATCFDGWRPAGTGTIGAHNLFRMDLGPVGTATSPQLRDVSFFVTRRAVKVRATRISRFRPNNPEVVLYVVESTFPMREYSHVVPSLMPGSTTSGFWDNNSQICIELDGPISPTVPPVSDVLALDNVFTSGSPSPGPSPLLTFESNGILNNNTSPCTSAVLATGARCGEGFVINMIMKR